MGKSEAMSWGERMGWSELMSWGERMGWSELPLLRCSGLLCL